MNICSGGHHTVAACIHQTANRDTGGILLNSFPHMNIIDTSKRLAGVAARRTPFVLQKKLFETVVGQIFKEPLQLGELDFLEGHCIKITLRDIQTSWIAGLRNGILILLPAGTPADAEISGNIDEFILLATGQEDPDTLFFQRRLSIEGSTAISLAVKNVMDSIGPLKLPKPLQTLLLQLVKISNNYSGGTTHSRPL